MRLLAALTIALLLASACSDGPGAPTAVPSPDRVDAIVDARAAVAQPAAELGAGAAEVRARATDLAAGAVTGIERRRAAAAALHAAATDLEAAAGSADGTELSTEVADVAAAAGALEAAAVAARELADAARQVSDRAVALAAAEEALAAVVATWDERGSRNEQVERLGAAADRASVVLDELRTVTPGPVCSTALERRIAFAEAVVAGTRDLQALVRQGSGSAFDQRRVELREQIPDDFAAADRDDRPCIERDSEVAAAAQRVEAALADVEGALNPGDLAASRVLGTPGPRS